ncbi:hypothetical protein CMI37_20865 [Candidatus Pacearchaeota archaeon]|nr:hypothetical protein [Candidatus Pacearchaeota archaeon]|tara:strand:+ start:9889 stop:10161 length:273 start_codon:yes stop_codon:yes gene_type:complete
MAFTTSFLVKNQAVGSKFQHYVRVTADAASGAFESGFGVVDFIQHSGQSATTAAYRVFMNANSGLTANNGSVAISGVASGDVIYMTVVGH